MQFPLKFNKMQFPSLNRCAWCKKKSIYKPDSSAVLSGGAMLINRRTGDGGPDDRLDGFLSLSWYGADTYNGGQGVDPDIYKRIDIARDITGGQYDINFCSTKCLRAFLNHAVDALEDKIAAKNKVKRTCLGTVKRKRGA